MRCEPTPKYTPRDVFFPIAEHNNTCIYDKDIPNDYTLSKGLFKSEKSNFSAQTEFYFDNNIRQLSDKELAREQDEFAQKRYNEMVQKSAAYAEKRKKERSLLNSVKSFFSKDNRKG